MNVMKRMGKVIKIPLNPISGGTNGVSLLGSKEEIARETKAKRTKRSMATMTSWVPPVSLAPIKFKTPSNAVILKAIKTGETPKASLR